MPRDVIEAAMSAFDARHPGAEVLSLVDDTRNGRGVHVLRFGDGVATVVVKVTRKDDLLQVVVTVEPSHDLALALEQLAPARRQVVKGATPAVFDQVNRGFVSITGARSGSSAPQWCTPWIRM